VTTTAGEEDVLAVNADCSQIRFTPGASKNFSLNIAREVGDHVRALSVQGVGAGPTSAMDVTVSPDLSIVRFGNRETARNIDVRVSVYDKSSNANATLDRNGVGVPVDHDMVVTVTDWQDLTLTVRSLPFSV
jgi:hypothetical protein